MTQLSVIFLGTGGSWPTVKRSVTSIAVKRGSDIILFDCGEGTQRQFQKSHLSYMQIKHIFISHFHGDHFLGLPGLIQTMQLNDREEPLHIYGPPGINQLVQQLVSLGYFKPSYEIISHEIKPKEILDYDGYSISALKVSHGIPSYAYKLQEKQRPGKFDKPKALSLGIPEGPLFGKLQKGEQIQLDDGRIFKPEDVMGPKREGRSLVYSGDTRIVEEMIDFSKGADLLIHEATYSSDLEDLAYQYGHCTAQQAATLAKKAGVHCLYLVHISPRYLDVGPLIVEARKIFANTFLPNDLEETEISLKK